MSDQHTTDPHQAHFDAWWTDFKARLRVANQVRLEALETTDEDDAAALHWTANQIVRQLREDSHASD